MLGPPAVQRYGLFQEHDGDAVTDRIDRRTGGAGKPRRFVRPAFRRQLTMTTRTGQYLQKLFGLHVQKYLRIKNNEAKHSRNPSAHQEAATLAISPQNG